METNAYLLTLPAHASLDRHNSKPAALSLDNLRKQVFQSSVPSLPSAGAPKDRRLSSHRHNSTPQLATGSFFLALGNPTRSIEMQDTDDAEDPHDLAFPTKHFPRASMVENLVMSLDQFSTPPAHDQDQPFVGSPQQGHGFAASVAADNKPRSKSSAHTRVDSRETIKIYRSVEEDEPQRTRGHESQRPVQPPMSKYNQSRSQVKSRSSSTSSSIDLGHLAVYSGRLGPAGNRRSQSFDFGSQQRPKPRIAADETLTSTTPAGTDAQRSPTAANFSGQLGRRNSGRSAKSVPKKGKSGTLGTNTVRRTDSPQALPPVRTITVETMDRKLGPENTPMPKPGFFKRVFGSSKHHSTSVSNANLSYASSSRISQDRSSSVLDITRPSTPPGKLQKQSSKQTNETPSIKDPPHTMVKKPSSFFRRRKKSISTSVPPPLPLTLNSNLQSEKIEKDVPSPVSSLRAFMDPYLGEGPRHTSHARGSSLQSVQNIDDMAPTIKAVPPDVESTTRDMGVTETTSQRASHIRTNSRELSKLEIPTSRSTVVLDSPGVESTNKKDGGFSPLLQQSPVPIDTEEETRAPFAASEPNSLKKSTSPTPSASQAPRDTTSRSETWHGETLTVPGRPPPIRASSTGSQKLQEIEAGVRSDIKVPESATGSETSDYKSAPSTPIVQDLPARQSSKSPHVHVSHPSISQTPTEADVERAQKIYDSPGDDINSTNACAWLGEAGSDRENIRKAYMELFDWTNHSILAAMRVLCSKLVLKGESQQVDRVLDSFARRWCECNNKHGFKSADVVHTICYSILLLNTDLHLADIGQKMTRPQFIRNSMHTIRQVAQDAVPTFLSVRSSSYNGSGGALRPSFDNSMRSTSALATSRPTNQLGREDSGDMDTLAHKSGTLVETAYTGSQSGWELQIEVVLKDVYTSISRDPLPLFGSDITGRQAVQQQQQQNNNLLSLSGLRRTPSVLSKAQSETRGRPSAESKSLGARWASKNRSRARLGGQGFGSSRTSIDDQSSAWSPSLSSTWSKGSIGRALTSMSVDSFGTDMSGGDYQSSIGFASALSQAIIRDEQLDAHADEGLKVSSVLEDESLELYGAPWAKEGILKHKCHFEGADKRSKDRNWNDCFAVIEKGWMRLFSFTMTAKTLRNKAKNQKAGGVVGGGNWQDNAEEVWKFMLRHTIASSLPPPGYSKQRPYVWALSLPNGAVHLFSVGTPDIVKEFVTTANFWSARLSKEPMTSGVSSMEYGWSEAVIGRSMPSDNPSTFTPGSPRPSTQLSMRSSIDHGNGIRPRLPGDRAHISEWNPPQQSLVASQLMEVDQLKTLQAYVKNVEEELQRHNEFRGPMLIAFSAKHPNSQKAMSNWEKKSSFLLREIVKFGTYIDALQTAQNTKDRVNKLRKAQEDERKADEESRLVQTSITAE